MQLDPLDQGDQWEIPEMKANQELKAQLVHQERMAVQESKEIKDLLEPQVYRDSPEYQGKRENQDVMVKLDPLDNRDLGEREGLREIQDLLDLLVTQVHKEKEVPQVLKEKLALVVWQE